jgi:hypothetical protein
MLDVLLVPLFIAFFKIWNKVLQTRSPISVSVSIVTPPIAPVIHVLNRSDKTPVVVRTVRIRYGSKDYGSSFDLSPEKPLLIEPKHQFDFSLPKNPIVGRHYNTSNPSPQPLGPSFNQPSDLTRAIMNGKSKDSWVEFDFNEFDKRRYLCGEIKFIFKACAMALKKQKKS